MKTFKEFNETLYLDEEKLSRVWQLAQKGAVPFGIMTGFRDEFTRAENLGRNKKIIDLARKAGFGYWVLDGSWVETSNTGKRKRVSEDSLFIAAPKTMKGSSKKIRKFIVNNVRDYDQDSGIFKESDSDTVKLFQHKIWKNGERIIQEKIIDIGQFNVAKIQTAYSKIRGSGSKFVFEGVYKRNPKGFGDAFLLSRPDLELEMVG